MSHFSVLVIGPNVEQQLAPYHEFECTGIDDQYVQEIDETEDRRDEFKTAKRSVVRCPNGELISPYDDRFYRDPTEAEAKEIGPTAGTGSARGLYYSSRDWGDGRGYRSKVHHIPEDHEKLELPFDNFRDYLRDYCEINEVSIDHPLDLKEKHKYHYTRIVNGDVDKVIRRTNPNAEWDWWVVGGRYSGLLKVKPGARGQLGKKGVLGSCISDGPGRADVATKRDIDFDGMRDEAGDQAAARWDRASTGRLGLTWLPWPQVREKHPGNIDAARVEYHAQPGVKATQEAMDNPWDGVDEYLADRDEYIQAARDRAISTYAIVKDSQWHAKGEMGWWGMSNDKITQSEWNLRINELLDGLPDDTLLTVVDCHI